MWATVAKYAVKLAVYAAGHPDQVIALANEGKAVASAVKNVVVDVKKS
jgi:hypothetical protein